MRTLFLLSLLTLRLFLVLRAQVFEICDCSNPTTIGFLNLDEPNDCSDNSQPVASTSIEYNLYRRNATDNSGIGFVCMKWKAVKKIVGYFFRSYDTTYEKTEVPVSRSECWDLSQNHLCPNPVTGESHPLIQHGDQWAYRKQPDGEPYYMQEVTYTEFNCVVQQITVRQNCPTCAIESSIGRLTLEPKSQYIVHGLSTIVWNPIQFEPPIIDCKLQHFRTGKGRLTMANQASYEALVKDETQQLEFRVNASSTECGTQNEDGKQYSIHAIIGISNIYIAITSDHHDFMFNRHRTQEIDNRRQRFRMLTHATSLSTKQLLQRPESFVPPRDDPHVITFDASLPEVPNQFAAHDHLLVALAKSPEQIISHKVATTSFKGSRSVITERFVQHNGTLCLFLDPDQCLTWLATQTKFGLYPPFKKLFAIQNFIHYKRNNRITIARSCLQQDRKTKTVSAGSCTTSFGVLSLEYVPESFQLRIETTDSFHSQCLTADTDSVAFTTCDENHPNQKWIWGSDLISTMNLPPQYASHADLNDELLDEFRKSKENMIEYEKTESARIKTELDQLFNESRANLTKEIEARNMTFQFTLQQRIHEAEKNATSNADALFRQWAQEYNYNLTQETAITIKNLTQERKRQFDAQINALHQRYKSDTELLRKNHSEQMRIYIEKEEICQNHLTECDLNHQQQDQAKNEFNPGFNAITDALYASHHIFMEDQAIERENVLAKEIRQIYCQVKRLRKFQALLLAQSSGIAAAKALNIKDQCSHLQATGENLLLQQCQPKTVTFTAVKTNCGFEPFVNGSTIAKDGYSLVPFQPCYWQGSLATFNGRPYKFLNDSWLIINSSIKIDNLHLIDHFQTLPDKELEYLLQIHAAQRPILTDQINIFGDITAQMSLTNAESATPILKNTDHSGIFNWTFTWLRNIKIAIITIVTLIILIPLCRCLIVCCITCRKRKVQINQITIDTPVTNKPNNRPSPISHDLSSHQHRHLRHDAVHGYMWSDGCPL